MKQRQRHFTNGLMVGAFLSLSVLVFGEQTTVVNVLVGMTIPLVAGMLAIASAIQDTRKS